jgi:hypothetical protein
MLVTDYIQQSRMQTRTQVQLGSGEVERVPPADWAHVNPNLWGGLAIFAGATVVGLTVAWFVSR